MLGSADGLCQELGGVNAVLCRHHERARAQLRGVWEGQGRNSAGNRDLQENCCKSSLWPGTAAAASGGGSTATGMPCGIAHEALDGGYVLELPGLEANKNQVDGADGADLVRTDDRGEGAWLRRGTLI